LHLNPGRDLIANWQDEVALSKLQSVRAVHGDEAQVCVGISTFVVATERKEFVYLLLVVGEHFPHWGPCLNVTLSKL
jgi:hypothetical protein